MNTLSTEMKFTEKAIAKMKNQIIQWIIDDKLIINDLLTEPKYLKAYNEVIQIIKENK